MLSSQEKVHYARHLSLPQFGEEAQIKLKNAKVLVIGAGGLGCPAMLYLAAAGVGRIGIMDADVVSTSNLQRQVLFSTEDVGKLKVEVARKRLLALNPHIFIETYPERLSAHNALAYFAEYDVILDASDNFATRYLCNDAAVLSGKALVYAAIFQFEGQLAVFNLRKGTQLSPNYRDLFPEPPPPDTVPSCAEAGVLGVLPGILGSMQALEAIKILTGLGEPLAGKFYTLDTLTFQSSLLDIFADPENPLTGDCPTQFELIDYEVFCQVPVVQEITFEEWKAQPEEAYFLLDVREKKEYEQANLGGYLIPLSELSDRAAELPRTQTILVHCQSGKRSLKAIQLLQEQGFRLLLNLKGGMEGRS